LTNDGGARLGEAVALERSSRPAAWKNSAISRDSGAEPEMKKRMRPPKRCCSLREHQLVGDAGT
jgi:hypothetical protein